jgi:DNA-binding transcriptional LysR family regulator
MERKARILLRRSEETELGLALPQVEHRELRYFVAVAEELHFTRAAEKLSMSQPPLSAAIAHLESKLGTQLFERDSRNVRLTAAGAALLERARPILRQMNEAVAATRRARLHDVAVLRLATDAASSMATAPALCLAVERSNPGLSVDVAQLVPAAIFEALRDGIADVAVLVADADEPGFELDLLRRVKPVAVFDRSHPLARRKRLSVEELAAYRLALWSEDEAPSSHRLVLSVFGGVEMRAGLALLPMFSGMWAEELAAGAFCVVPADAPITTTEFAAVPISDAGITFDTRLAWSPDSPPPLLDSIREAAAALRDERGWAEL